MRGARITIAIGLLLAAVPCAHAGTVYRCDGADGTPTYGSKRVKGARCTVISRYTPSSPAARTAPPPVSVTVTPPPPVAPAPAAMVPLAAAPAAVALPPSPPPARAANTTRRVQGQVYSYIKDGVRNYTSKPPRGVAGATSVRTIRYSFLETCYACAPLPGVNF